MRKHDPQVRIRLSAKLTEWLAAQSLANCRSLNGEIEYRLLKAREDEQAGRESGAPAAGSALRA